MCPGRLKTEHAGSRLGSCANHHPSKVPDGVMVVLGSALVALDPRRSNAGAAQKHLRPDTPPCACEPMQSNTRSRHSANHEKTTRPESPPRDRLCFLPSPADLVPLLPSPLPRGFEGSRDKSAPFTYKLQSTRLASLARGQPFASRTALRIENNASGSRPLRRPRQLLSTSTPELSLLLHSDISSNLARSCPKCAATLMSHLLY